MPKKPSPAQLKLLRQLAEGSRVQTRYGVGYNALSRIVNSDSTGWGTTVHGSTVWAAKKAGWLSIVKEDWRERVYELSDEGRAALAGEGGQHE